MTYSVQFTEKMIGAFTFGSEDYQAGSPSGLGRGSLAGGALMFRLTIRTDDIDSFVADRVHAAVAQGYVQADVLGGRLPVQQGLFNLFVDEGSAVRHMLYRLYFSDRTGRPLTLAGFKDVRPGPLTKVWPETSTLYVRVLDGHVPVTDGGQSAREGIVGSGVAPHPAPGLRRAGQHLPEPGTLPAWRTQSPEFLRQAVPGRVVAGL